MAENKKPDVNPVKPVNPFTKPGSASRPNPSFPSSSSYPRPRNTPANHHPVSSATRLRPEPVAASSTINGPRPIPAPELNNRRPRSWCRISLITSVSIVVLLLIAGGAFWLFNSPRFPVFYLQHFRILSLDVTSKPDGYYLNATAVARVGVWNPNQQMTLRFGASVAKIMVKDSFSTDVQLGPASQLDTFREKAGEEKSLKIQGAVTKALVGSRFLTAYKRKSLLVRVELKTRMGFDRGVMVAVNVKCGEFTIKQIEGGDQPKCVINTLKWINIH